ncbi:hypothetical protein Tco_1277309 [Tanacetum coccineum]
MTSFRLLHLHLKVLSIKEGFEQACMALFDQDKQTFTESLLLNLEHLEKQLDREEFQETESINSFRVLMEQFQTFINFRYYFDDFDGAMIRKRVNDRVMQSKEGKVDSSKALDAGLVIKKSNVTESERHVSSSRSKNDTHVEETNINSVNDKEPMAQINKEIEVLETINIELEQSVAKLLAENEKLHKENEHLKQTYKDLYDSIKKTSVQTKDHADSLIVQLNCKSVENADLKAQIQEKIFANVALKNELRKLKENSVDTKFAKPSILGKPQPPRNQSVVRQPNVFKSERPNFSKPRFASQVDVNNVLSKPVTQHYLPKGKESAFAKPNHMIASSSSRNNSKNMLRFSSNDMVHNHYLEKA